MRYSADPVINAIAVAWLEGRYCTIPSIASRAGVSDATARKRIRDNMRGGAPLVQSLTSYREFGRRYRSVAVYIPNEKFQAGIKAAKLRHLGGFV